MRKKSFVIKDMDMTNGPLLKNLIAVSLPLALSGILQLLFNAADLIVIGRFSQTSTQSLAAVSSNTALINLIVNVAIGISIGANVVMAQAIGAKDEDRAQAALHNSMLLSIVLGVVVGIIGSLCARYFLVWMQTDPAILDKATDYLRIYFIGAPANIIFNFGASILRAKGDTKRPLFYLSVAGVLNVCLNLIFVIVARLDVVGVAVATIVSEYVSCILLVITMFKEKGYCKLQISKLKFNKNVLKSILKVGLPSGILSSFFSVANVLIQTNLNGFGYALVAGSSTASNLEGFVYTSMNAVSNASVSFAGQNYGAGKFKRIKKVAVECSFMVLVISLVFTLVLLLAGKYIAALYTTDETVIAYAVDRMRIILPIYFVCGVVEIMVGCLRGMGYSVTPTLASFFCVCVFRIIWIYTACKAFHTPQMLYLSWPISWMINFFIDAILLFAVFRKKETEASEFAPTAGRVVEEYSSYEEMKAEQNGNL
ncbi:MAG: MATE family efflux transporter [Firmicutes bacterium]|nr:MATE family efflux transporter [Bacillota bacterium]